MARILWAIQWWQLSALTTAAPIACELRARGHDITFLATVAAEQPLKQLGFSFRAEQRVPAYDWGRQETMPASLSAATEEYQRWAIEMVPARMMEVIDALEAGPYDLVVTDSRLLGAGLGAERAKRPWVSYLDFCFDDPGTGGSQWSGLWNAVRGRVGLPPDERPTAESRWLGLSPHLTLVTGFPRLMASHAVLPSYIHEVGPLLWDPPLAGDAPRWLEDLGDRRPAVLVSTSSGWLSDADLVKLVGEALDGRDIDVIATVPAEQPVPPLPSNVLVTGYFPHSLLMPKVDLLVCSAGFGVTARALSAGVPVVAVPRGADGFRVAGAIAGTGAGMAVLHDGLAPRRMRIVLEQALANLPMQEAARQLGESSQHYNAPVTAAALIEDLLARGP